MSDVAQSYTVLTRPLAQSKALAEDLADAGIETLVCPLLSLELCEADWPEAQEMQAAVFTSARAIEAIIAAGMGHRYKSLRCFCVGGDTAKAARGAGFRYVHVGSGGARNLDVFIRAVLNPQGGAVFYPCGRDVSYPLQQKLEEAGFCVIQRPVYEMKAVEQLPEAFLQNIQAGKVSIITFYSARTARVFLECIDVAVIAERLAQIKLLCISASVLECVQHLNWAGTFVPDRPNGSAMRALIQEHASV